MCAIPTCRYTTTEIAHIEPWAKVQEHTFENLIALCPNCHTRFDQKKDIPKASVLRFKANLSVINARFGPMERQVLEAAADRPEQESFRYPRGMEWAFSNLVRGRLAEIVEREPTWGTVHDGSLGMNDLRLTALGRDTANRIREGRLLTAD
ncbi:HNH endonuclease [Streptomyces sp. NBC_00424]|uniref:HNH endonuclease signature motif containing protein n=2 Tax=unclassified Streptomyces TaxID=2593676 RepID=UPI00225BAB09|nr:HNH endonuclease signature motif containing protein [Streptomyces sp. NBC_00424]MCX5077697.1 HNH endonuclease [Streptomyces sp. NBC_00424]